MKLKISQLLGAQESLARLIQRDLDVSLAWKFSKLVKHLNSELETYNEQRVGLFKKYGKLQKNGKEYKVIEAKLPAFNEEMQKLLAIEVDLAFEPVDIAQFEGIKMSTVDLLNLEAFFKD